jgi:hypothetical protein
VHGIPVGMTPELGSMATSTTTMYILAVNF